MGDLHDAYPVVVYNSSTRKYEYRLLRRKSTFGSCVCNNLKLVPDEPGFGSVDEVQAVSCEVLPANFIGVMPQCSDLRRTDKHRIQG